MKNFALGHGLHLTLDGYECSQEQLANLDVIYEFLDKCPDVIQMTKIMPPYVFKYHAPAPEDWGVSGFVLIAESHISIHTYPEKRYLSLDTFSCKHFGESQPREDLESESHSGLLRSRPAEYQVPRLAVLAEQGWAVHFFKRSPTGGCVKALGNLGTVGSNRRRGKYRQDREDDHWGAHVFHAS